MYTMYIKLDIISYRSFCIYIIDLSNHLSSGHVLGHENTSEEQALVAPVTRRVNA